MVVISSSKVILLLLFLSCLQTKSVSDKPPSKRKGLRRVIRRPLANITRAIYNQLIQHADEPVPDSFDAREKWPHCVSIRRIINQGQCNSCWAVSASMVLTDRLCITTNGEDLFEYSIEDLLGCCKDCIKRKMGNPCMEGGFVEEAIDYFEKKGVVSGGDGCKPMTTATARGHGPSCRRECTNPNYNLSYNEDKRFSKGYKFLDLQVMPVNIKQMQIEIMKNGPVVAVMESTEYFENNYANEVFQKPGQSEELHGVRLIGWGNESGTPYWLAANSWGRDWGKMGGFFKILRGKNFLDIESTVTAPFAARRRHNRSAKIQNISSTVFASSLFIIYLCSLLYS